MADRRTHHANTKLAGHSRASARLEQRTYRRSKAPAEAQACLGNSRAARVGGEALSYTRYRTLRLHSEEQMLAHRTSFKADTFNWMRQTCMAISNILDLTSQRALK